MSLIYEFLLNRGLEKRSSQEILLKKVFSLIEEGGVLAIEAPTGTGKTYGYLIPIIESGQKAIVSTGTKLLQEQLRRDIEFLRGQYHYLTGKEFSYVILKGKSNYMCLDRYNQLKPEEVPLELRRAVESDWDGDFEFVELDREIISKINIDDDYCNAGYRRICPYKQNCYYWGKLKLIEKKSQLLVVNHALLALREFEDSKERILIIDEAHELDKHLTSSLTNGVSLYSLRFDILPWLNSFVGLEIDLEGFFRRYVEPLFNADAEEISLRSLENLAEPFRAEILVKLKNGLNEAKNILKKTLRDYVSSVLFVSMEFKDYIQSVGLLDWSELLSIQTGQEGASAKELEILESVKNYDKVSRRIARLESFLEVMKGKVEGMGYLLRRVFSKRLQGYNYYILSFPIFPRGAIDFYNFKGTILLSATLDEKDLELTIGFEGDFAKLNHSFDYSKVNFIAFDVDPREDKWSDCLVFAFKELLKIHDKVLVLLTNKEHLGLFKLYDGVALQGDAPLSKLVQDISQNKLRALVGLDSLWFGLDIKGRKGILMAKLPFENPNEPITFHRRLYLEKEGENPFDYQMRKALIKFRQGLGRLMRSSQDEGTIMLCDKRIFRFKKFEQSLKELGVSLSFKRPNL
ncbi:MAG: ATP-dependent DNA helicase [Aquificaceae bacterium]|nr:ATP-dependent DNA helicase [Aquificaceae bacterium]MDW8237405.1 ATP-dependent DNA helicase [Aquificaceae bacterium]